MARTVLVTGGTGTLGRHVVGLSLDAGHTVRVLSRGTPANEEGRCGWSKGDLCTGEGIAAAVVGADVVVHCATTNGRRDVDASQTLFNAARAAGTSHLIYVSIVGVDVVPLSYYRAKLAVEHRLASSGLGWSILRATQFHDLVTRVFSLQDRLPVLMVPRGIQVQPVDVREVAAPLVQLVDSGPSGRTPDLGGPQVRSTTDLARVYLESRRRRKRIVAIPMVGRAARVYRAGGHLTPEHATGTLTYEQFLGSTA